MTGVEDLPTGTVTFLFTDPEGSTRLLRAQPAAYRDAGRRYHDLLRGAAELLGAALRPAGQTAHADGMKELHDHVAPPA